MLWAAGTVELTKNQKKDMSDDEGPRDFKLLVMSGSKKIRCNLDDVTSMYDLNSKLGEKLGRRRVSSLEFYDNEFEEWASAVHISDVPSKCKVRIIENELKSPVPPQTPIPLKPKISKKMKRDSMYKAAKESEGTDAEELFHAMDNNDHETALKLIRAGKAKGVIHEDGDTVLIWATILDNIEIVKAVTEYDPKSLDEQSSNGNTALMWATELEHADIAKFLMEKGASTDFKNHDGMNAIAIAKSMGHSELESVLSGPFRISKEVSGL